MPRAGNQIYPWLDRSGQLSVFKLAVFLSLFAPSAWTLFSYEHGTLGPRPLIEAIHQTGLWAIRFLMISLAITPLRGALRWPRLILVRRMVGLAAFSYAAVHLTLYILDQAFDWRLVASEIAFRFYLTLGFLALISLSVLAATSTDGALRRLGGRRWRRLHQSVYFISILALTHYFIQSKLNVDEPMVVAGLFFWLMAYRAILWIGGEDRRPSVLSLVGLSVMTGLVTTFGEAAYYHFANGLNPWRVLAASFGWYFDRRPGWIALAICMALTMASALRARQSVVRDARKRPARPNPTSRHGDGLLIEPHS